MPFVATRDPDVTGESSDAGENVHLGFLSGAVAVPLLAQPDEARTGFNSIRADALKGHIYFLSSEELGGRLAELSGARGRQLRGEPLHERETRVGNYFGGPSLATGRRLSRRRGR